MTVASLLAKSRAAHLAKKVAAGRTDNQGRVISAPNYPQAEAHIREAIRCREEAHQLDPQKADPAWGEDEGLNRMPSEKLLAWFRHYLEIP